MDGTTTIVFPSNDRSKAVESRVWRFPDEPTVV